VSKRTTTRGYIVACVVYVIAWVALIGPATADGHVRAVIGSSYGCDQNNQFALWVRWA
jgi:hypothetical protein